MFQYENRYKSKKTIDVFALNVLWTISVLRKKAEYILFWIC